MDFYLPTRILVSRGVVRESAARFRALGGRCFIVTGGQSAKLCGALDDATAALTEAGIAFEIYDGIKPNPTIASCIEGGRRAAAFGADFILGIGGGSPLDAAKAVALSASNPTLDTDGLYAGQWPEKPLPIALIGTTAGTGSEVTPVAVITDTAGRKHSFRDDTLYAVLALGDPVYTATQPAAVTASTGVDALAHCLESLFSKRATDVSRAFALEGVAVLVPPLQAVAAGFLPDARQREALYHGSLLGGMAISVTGTVFPHNLGYYLTESRDVPHGVACAVFLPALLRHAVSAAPAEVKTLLCRAGTDAETLTALIRSLLPTPLPRLTEDELEAVLPRWENAKAVRNTIGTLTLADVRAILSELL